MNYPWLEEYLTQKPGARKEYKEEWQSFVYLLGGKMFALQGGDKAGKPIISFKLDPSHGDMLRQAFPDIIPGYYLNKLHWNSLYLAGAAPDEVVRGMADESYRLIWESLSQKKRREILML
jgi:predicted DNA-binding protein (MmcQ/YjbR family)